MKEAKRGVDKTPKLDVNKLNQAARSYSMLAYRLDVKAQVLTPRIQGAKSQKTY